MEKTLIHQKIYFEMTINIKQLYLQNNKYHNNYLKEILLFLFLSECNIILLLFFNKK